MDLENVLNQFGLKKEITCREPDFDFWDKNEFTKYIESEYLKSKTKEVDEVYNMSEFILLHKKTGIRLRIIYSESYYGDILDYKIIQVFVLFNNGEKSIITDLNLDKHTFSTQIGTFDFNSISKI